MATDDELRKMEKYLAGIFSEASKDLTKKAADYMSDFARKDAVKQSKVESGEITDDEYKEWRKNQLLYGQHWTRLIQLVQKEMVDCNKTALDYVNGKTTQIYADSYNSIAKVIDRSPIEGYSFELVDANTVKNLAKEDGIILPPKKNLDIQKDKLWNAKQVNAQLLQGILQGESIPKIAGRMANVCESNKSASIRNARTMVTAAENSGRQSGMNKAESDGVVFKKMWIATSDERTRDTHNVLNGQVVNNNENFVTFNGDELEFPGDWRAEPSEVYNCRCTLGTIVTGFNKIKIEETTEEVTEEQEIIEQAFTNNLNGVVDKAMQVYGSNADGKFFMERVQEALDKADDRYTGLYNQYIADTSFKSDGDGNWYDPDSKSVNINIKNVDDYTHESFLHEMGHRILDGNVDIWDRYKEEIHNAIESDSETMMKYVVETYCPEYIDKWHKGKYGYYFDSYNELRKRVQPDYDTAESVLNDALYKFLTEARKETLNSDDSDSFMSFSRFSDTIDGLTDGHFSKVSFFGGHGEQYYWGNEENITHEFFANSMALETLKRNAILELAQKYSPKLYSVYGKMLSEIVESRKK